MREAQFAGEAEALIDGAPDLLARPNAPIT
jgi:hypothetical protein